MNIVAYGVRALDVLVDKYGDAIRSRKEWLQTTIDTGFQNPSLETLVSPMVELQALYADLRLWTASDFREGSFSEILNECKVLFLQIKSEFETCRANAEPELSEPSRDAIEKFLKLAQEAKSCKPVDEDYVGTERWAYQLKNDEAMEAKTQSLARAAAGFQKEWVDNDGGMSDEAFDKFATESKNAAVTKVGSSVSASMLTLFWQFVQASHARFTGDTFVHDKELAAAGLFPAVVPDKDRATTKSVVGFLRELYGLEKGFLALSGLTEDASDVAGQAKHKKCKQLATDMLRRTYHS